MKALGSSSNPTEIISSLLCKQSVQKASLLFKIPNNCFVSWCSLGYIVIELAVYIRLWTPWLGGWRDGAAVKRIDNSSRGQRFSSQYPSPCNIGSGGIQRLWLWRVLVLTCVKPHLDWLTCTYMCYYKQILNKIPNDLREECHFFKCFKFLGFINFHSGSDATDRTEYEGSLSINKLNYRK